MRRSRIERFGEQPLRQAQEAGNRVLGPVRIHRAENPIPGLLRLAQGLLAEPLDAGTAHFDASNLESRAPSGSR
jgi:hypothetical protein